MKILDVFKSKSAEEENELDRLVNAILDLVKARDAAKQTLDGAKTALQEALAKSVATGGTASADKQTSAVAAAQARYDAASDLIRKAQFEAQALIRSDAPGRRGKISELKAKIKSTQKAMDRRLVAEIAAFAQRNGLSIKWGIDLMAGQITIPATCLAPG